MILLFLELEASLVQFLELTPSLLWAHEVFMQDCFQLDLMKPLINTIWVDRLLQKVMYEGMSSLCFCCGRLGHK